MAENIKPEKVAEKTLKEATRLEKIAGQLQKIELQQITNYLQSPWRIIWVNFLAGTFRGLGFLVGAALVLTLIGFVLTNILSEAPIVGDFFEVVRIWIEDAIEQTQNAIPQNGAS
ncbi:hypothetical protein COV82_04175 [Candidatus Peregrinibacteria bacterium CG11_big_fil_rev_8_21_14_0_20_46_8]|nr:MAG: hypothetical protein COV82_04175 [Candidatus Peregrinibacteria bacterium CG11_big_fil_rev_8_21_14_0_20_46_8]